MVISQAIKGLTGFKLTNTQNQVAYLNSATGVKRRVIIAASPGIRGSMVVSLAIMEDPPGFKPTNPAHSNLMWGSCGSSSIATEFTLSGSILAFLEQRMAKLLFTLCMLGNFSCHLSWLFFSKLTFSKNSFRNTIRVSNSLDPDQDQ